MFYQNPKLSLKLFDSLVKPILLYCSDFWGCLDTVITQNSPMETLNTSICKQLLGVKKHTSNIACKLELGRYPLHIDAVKKCIQNWSRVHRGEACNIIKIVPKQSNENVWTSSMESKLSRVGFGYIWANETLTKQEIDSQLPNIVQRLMDCTVQDYFSILQSQTKLRTYVKYKHDFKLEPYVTKLNFKGRQELSRSRLSDHKLKVEVGRVHKTQNSFVPIQ